MTDHESTPIYRIERISGGGEGWAVIGPNGLAGVYQTASEAQAKADDLNAQVAEERENDN